MRTWQTLDYTNTFGEMVDKFNQNSDSSAFIDNMVGTILSNGVLYSGKETVDGMLIQPLKKVGVSGTVNSDTVFDNFTLYYRDTNQLITLDQFPIDLLSYANGRPQFLYIRQDLSYRVSDYMFGQADEILLARFVINTNSTWNQLYIIAQRAGTPMYNAADEFYDIEGMYVTASGDIEPGYGLGIGNTDGTIKRSGIDFTDKVSPDICDVPYRANAFLRYNTAANEIDYTQDATQKIITNKILTYNMDVKYKIEAEDRMYFIQNLCYNIKDYCTNVSDELHTAIVSGGDEDDLKQITDSFSQYIVNIRDEVNLLYTFLNSNTVKAVMPDIRRQELMTWHGDVSTGLNTIDAAEKRNDYDDAVDIIKTFDRYFIEEPENPYDKPLDVVLQDVQDDLNKVNFDVGTFSAVPTGKFSIQRILYDVYEQVFIVQYGDTIYEDFDSAVEGTNLLAYPAPYAKTIYVPLAILIVKSGATNLATDPECIIIDRRWIEVDQEMSDYADYVARAKIEKVINQINNIINGTIAVNKADSLKCTVNGATVYKDGNYFLNYDNLQNKISVINNLTTSSYNAKQALSAYQGYLLNRNKVNKSGDTMTGTLNSRAIIPTSNNTYNLGSSSNRWNVCYVKTLNATSITSSSTSAGTLNATGITLSPSNTSHSGISSNGNYITFSDDNSVYNIQAMSKSSADTSSTWNNIKNRTVVFCW